MSKLSELVNWFFIIATKILNLRVNCFNLLSNVYLYLLSGAMHYSDDSRFYLACLTCCNFFVHIYNDYVYCSFCFCIQFSKPTLIIQLFYCFKFSGVICTARKQCSTCFLQFCLRFVKLSRAEQCWVHFCHQLCEQYDSNIY